MGFNQNVQRMKPQLFPFSFWISLSTSSNMWPCRVRVSLQKGQAIVAPSVRLAMGCSVFRPQMGHVKDRLSCFMDQSPDIILADRLNEEGLTNVVTDTL